MEAVAPLAPHLAEPPDPPEAEEHLSIFWLPKDYDRVLLGSSVTGGGDGEMGGGGLYVLSGRMTW